MIDIRNTDGVSLSCHRIEIDPVVHHSWSDRSSLSGRQVSHSFHMADGHPLYTSLPGHNLTSDLVYSSTLDRPRAAQYIRMTTDHQTYSPENHLDAIEKYASLFSMEVVQTYSDL